MTLLLLLLTSATAWADEVSYSYIKADGTTGTATATKITTSTSLSGGWYVVDNDIDGPLTFTGDVNLIILDNKNVTITGSDGIVVMNNGNLTIYGQSQGTGSLSVKATGYEGDGIYASGSISIIGGIITTTGENGINAIGNITITGGNVTSNGLHYGIVTKGTVTLSGGLVTANGTGNLASRAGISANEGASTIYLSGAIVTASSYSGTVTVQGDVTYKNYELTNIDVSSLNGVTIFPTTCFGIASGNDGSQEKPYTITSPEELQLLAFVVNEGNTLTGMYIQLSNDLDMYGIAFRPIGVDSEFCGHFDGGGYIISNLNINIDDICIGLFGFVNNNNATVQNITISNATITGKEYVGGIVGSLDNGSIKNCCVINSNITITAPAYYSCGAIVGHCGNSTTLANNYYSGCTVAGKNSGVGCGGSSSPSDISANDGALSATILSDSENVPSSLSGKVVFRRVFTGGKASTICLPFAYTPKNSDGAFYTFDGITKNGETYEATMTVVTSTPLSPNMPYLFVPAGSNTLKPVLFHGTAAYDASELTDTKTPWTFIGTYSPLDYGTDPFSGHVYGFAAKAKGDVIAGEFVMADDGAYIPAMRCYLKYNNSASTRGETEELPGRITVKLVGDPTSIGTLNTRTGEVTFDGWYSLDGQRFNSKPTKKGLYIYKGIKVTIK